LVHPGTQIFSSIFSEVTFGFVAPGVLIGSGKASANADEIIKKNINK